MLVKYLVYFRKVNKSEVLQLVADQPEGPVLSEIKHLPELMFEQKRLHEIKRVQLAHRHLHKHTGSHEIHALGVATIFKHCQAV